MKKKVTLKGLLGVMAGLVFALGFSSAISAGEITDNSDHCVTSIISTTADCAGANPLALNFGHEDLAGKIDLAMAMNGYPDGNGLTISIDDTIGNPPLGLKLVIPAKSLMPAVAATKADLPLKKGCTNLDIAVDLSDHDALLGDTCTINIDRVTPAGIT